MQVLTPSQLQELKKQQELEKSKTSIKFKEDKYKNRLRSGTQRAKDILDKIDYFQSSISSFITKDIVDEEVEKVKGLLTEENKNRKDEIKNLTTDIRTKAKKEHAHSQSDIIGLDDRIEKINTELNLLPDKVLNEAKKLIPNVTKPKVEDIIGLDSKLGSLDTKISSIKIPDISELCSKEELDNYYTKKETYDKDTIDDKIRKHKTGEAGYNYINDSITDPYFTWSSEKIQEVIDGNYTPFQVITNAQRLALSPSVGRVVYCSDEIEGIYIYTSDGRQRLQTLIVS